MKYDLVFFEDGKIPQISSKVDVFDNDILEIYKAMFEALPKYSAIGLAAIQLGISKRIVVANINNDKIFAVNPEIIWKSEETNAMEEGNVSIPNVRVQITRPKKIKVKFQNEKGEERILEADGLLATCLQHEVEQLDGISILSNRV